MVQAHARELLNQKDVRNTPSMPSKTPPSLFTATERLITALDRLERNLEHLPVGKDGQSKQRERLIFFEKENEALRQERENLNAAVLQLQSQYNGLHQVASTIYGKLDDSIKRLTQIMEN